MMKRATLPLASLMVCLLFWLLELVTLRSVHYPERPFGIAMHATALTIAIFALSVRRRSPALIISLVVSLALWTLKLVTTEVTYLYEGEGGETGVIWRGTPALRNEMTLDASLGESAPRYITLFRPECVGGYGNEKHYRWLTSYGYLWGTALSVMLFARWTWSRRLPTQAAFGPQSHRTVYRG